MKIELKQIIDELTDAINLPKGQKVAALIDIDKIVSWTIVDVHEDGSIKPISNKKFNSLKELISEYKWLYYAIAEIDKKVSGESKDFYKSLLKIKKSLEDYGRVVKENIYPYGDCSIIKLNENFRKNRLWVKFQYFKLIENYVV